MNLLKNSLIGISLSLLSFSSFAVTHCGNFELTGGNDGLLKVNGDTVGTQKINFLKQNGDYENVKISMTLMPASDGNMYGFEYFKRNGKSWLNVQLLQNSMDAPKIIGSFPCKKVS
ncbi:MULTISPECIES: hypothetical protein [Yersinia]|uniref:hypothetical protein n=1 Tax=Yersinia TaxID=629 RepID=UPI00110E6FB8|nr:MULTISPECIES: hypothetical protein [Yersinia]QDW33782.1 hypothetical protein FFE93_012385 [Yersinia sp. KBS0713]